MSLDLKIENVRDAVLDYSKLSKPWQSPIRQFFQFFQYPREFNEPGILSDCFFTDVHVASPVANWPTSPAPADPRVFSEAFAPLLASLVGPEEILTLFVKGSDRRYFDELKVIDDVIVPRSLRYVLLWSTPPPRPDPRFPMGAGNLLFEWPVKSSDYIVREWFHSPGIEVEGYISRKSALSEIVNLYVQPDTEIRIRELLRRIEIGVRLWPDNNGLFLLSDKYDQDRLRKRLGAYDSRSVIK